MGDILPCPFCGESLTQRGEGLNYRHPENDCFFGSRVFTNDQIPAWNIRADLVPQWQPIETAPRDGKKVLAFFPLFKTTRVAWHKTFHLDGPLWACDAVRSPDRWSDQPTMWMPLPSPPEAV